MSLKLATLRALRRAAGPVVSSHVRHSAATATATDQGPTFVLQALEGRVLLHHTPPVEPHVSVNNGTTTCAASRRGSSDCCLLFQGRRHLRGTRAKKFAL